MTKALAAWLALGMLSVGASAGEALRVVLRNDGSASVASDGAALIRSISLELSCGDTPAKVLPARIGAPARASVGGRTYSLSVSTRKAGSGEIIEFAATPESLPKRSPWEEPPPIRAAILARLAKEFQGGVISLDGQDALIGEELSCPEVKTIRLTPPAGEDSPQPTVPALTIEGETAGPVQFAPQGAVFALKMLETFFEPDSPLAMAIYVGPTPYDGPPIFLSEPAVRNMEGLGCVELVLRTFGKWRDPFGASDVELRASPNASGAKKDFRGYFGREYRATDGSSDSLEPRGLAGLRVRLPTCMVSGEVMLSLSTNSGRTGFAFKIPGKEIARPAQMSEMFAGATLPSGLDLVKACELLKRLSAAGVRLVRMPVYEAPWRLSGTPSEDPCRIDQEAAWRIDRLLEEAGRTGIRLVLTLLQTPPEDEMAERAAKKLLGYSLARWGCVECLEGLEVQGPPPPGCAPVRHDMPFSILYPDRAQASENWLFGEVLELQGALQAGRAESARVAFSAAAASKADILLLELPRLQEVQGPDKERLLHERHAALWAAAVGAPSRIFTGVGVDPSESAPLLRFASAAAQSAWPMPEQLVIAEEGWQLFGRRGRRGAIWWMEAIDRPGLVRGAAFELAGLEPGRYRLEWWHSYDGRLLTALELRVPAEGRTSILAPRFTSALAGRLIRLETTGQLR